MAKVSMKAQNIMLSGFSGGGNPPLDRGADMVGVRQTSNPFHRANYLDRWRELINWYYTSWMARKGVDIPVEDAMRGGFEFKHVDPVIGKKLKRRWDELNGDDQLERCCKQERLLGGCALLMLTRDKKIGDKKALMSDPLNLSFMASNPGALTRLNTVDINRISIPNPTNDVFSESFDNPQIYTVDGVEVDKSRLIVFDGKPLFGRTTYSVLFPAPRVNPAGFGESIITPVYDDLVRTCGTAQAAFHLVNMASVMLIMMQDFAGLQTTKTGDQKISKMQDICNSISLYKGAILDGVDVDVKNLPASFGSVPELVQTFTNFLAAAWDIPATRFVGTSPGGMNATGESDLENYYNMVQAYRERRLTPRIMQITRLLAIEQYGIEQGNNICNEIEVSFKSLWNLDTKSEAEAAKTWLDAMTPLLDRGTMSPEDFEAEAKKRGILLLADTKIKEPEALGDGGILSDTMDQMMGGGKKDGEKKEKPDASGPVQE